MSQPPQFPRQIHVRGDGPDAALIRALHAAPRASVSELAAAVNETRAAVSLRLRELRDSGAIRITGAVNPGYLGLSVIAHVSVACHSSMEEAAALAQTHDEVVLVSAVSGEYHFVMEVRVRTHDHLHTLLTRFRELPSVARLSTIIYSRVIRGAIAHDSFDPVTIDDVDTRIIGLLRDDGRASFRFMSDVVGLSPSAVRARVQRLLDSRVLKVGVVEARGSLGARMLMGVGLGIGPGGDRIAEFLHDCEFVDFAAETVGPYDAIATISGATPIALLEGAEHLRRLPGVTRTTTWAHLKSIKEDYSGLG